MKVNIKQQISFSDKISCISLVMLLILIPVNLFGQNIGKFIPIESEDWFTWNDVLPEGEIQFLLDVMNNNPHLNWDFECAVSQPLDKVGALPTNSTSFQFVSDEFQTGWILVGGYAIFSVNLYDSSLTGSIPETLGNLTYMDFLRLDSNQLTGSIPQSIGNLTNLAVLNLSSNQLTGGIPQAIGNLANLTVLDLSSNQLTGEIPQTIGNISSLEFLFLRSNYLAGEIPQTLGNISNLVQLDLAVNELTGELPETIGNLSKLEWLNLSFNQLSGEVPLTINGLSDLELLWLSHNQLTGELPGNIGELTGLQWLYVDNNELTGDIPSSIGNLSKLTTLSLWGNQLSGSIPQSIGDLLLLQNLWLSDNQLTGEIPSSIGNLTQLESLQLYWNQLSGELPGELGNLANVTEMYLQGNSLTGSIPAGVWNLLNLVSLNLSGNQFTDMVFYNLSGNSTLQVLDLSWNQIEGELEPGVGGLTGLTHLNVAGNRLHGPLPTSLLNLGNLSVLDISYNDFKAQVNKPAWITTVGALSENGVFVWEEPQFWRRIGTISQVHGSVIIREERGDGTIGEWEAEVNDFLFENDMVISGLDSACTLLLLDHSAITVGSNSEMRIQLFSDKEPSIYEVIKGRIRRFLTDDYVGSPDHSKTNLYIKSPFASLGVRGTDVEITYSEEGMDAEVQVTLYSGIIDFVDLLTGEMITLEDTGTITRTHTLTPAISELLDHLSGLQPDPAAVSLFSAGQSDRLTNLAKIAFNLDLHSSDRSSFAVGGGQARGLPVSDRLELYPEFSVLTMTYPRRKDLELTYTPLYSTNLLEGWMAFPDPVSVTPINDDWDEVVVEVEIPKEMNIHFTMMNIGLPVEIDE